MLLLLVLYLLFVFFCIFFFFKQKTAYEMRISDWSSDVCSSDLAAWLSERLLGFSSKRTLPKWRRDIFTRQAASVDADAADVVLFADTFNNYFEAGNARAALQVLQAAGYNVHIAGPAANDPESGRPLCCGRRSDEHTSELQ